MVSCIAKLQQKVPIFVNKIEFRLCVRQNIKDNGGAELSQAQSELGLEDRVFFRWARPTSISEFSVRGCVGASVRVRKLVEAELIITRIMKVVTLDE